MHSHHLAALLVNLEEAGVIQADDPHLRPLGAPQADPLATEDKAQGESLEWEAADRKGGVAGAGRARLGALSVLPLFSVRCFDDQGVCKSNRE